MQIVEADRPSPFAASLAFGFVMDWLYGDDTPRAERRAALLSVDRALLDEVMGTEGGAADDDTLRAMQEILAERRGTAPSRRARTADELAHLLDRAGDLTPEELRARVAEPDEWRRGDPVVALLGSTRALAIPFPSPSGSEWRIVLTETYPRYAAALGVEAVSRVRVDAELSERDAADVLPQVLRVPGM